MVLCYTQSVKTKTSSSVYKENFKIVFIVNNNLRMTKGKIISQCMHGYDQLLENCLTNVRFGAIYRNWKSDGCTKVVLQGETGQLNAIAESLKKTDLNYSIICDVGRTQVVSGSNTIIAIGPGEIEKINEITGHLRLY